MSDGRRRLQIRMGTLILLVVVAACISWAVRVARDNDPVNRWTVLLRDPSTDHRREAAIELARDPEFENPERASAMLPSIIAALDDPDSGVRVEVMRCLNNFALTIKGTPGAPAVSANPGAELVAVVTALTKLSHDPDPLIRAEAINGLTPLSPHSRSAVPDIAAALKDSEANVRSAAVAAIMHLGGTPTQVANMIAPLVDDSDPTVRMTALGAFSGPQGLVDPKVLIPVYVKKLADSDERVRAAAKSALQLSDDSALPILLSIFCDRAQPDAVRKEVAEALQFRMTPGWFTAVGPLMEALHADDPKFHSTILRMLAQIGGNPVTEMLLGELRKRDPRELPEVMSALKLSVALTRQEQDVKEAIAAFNDNSLRRQLGGLRILQVLGASSEAAIPALTELANRSDAELRKAATETRNDIEKAVSLRGLVLDEAVKLVADPSPVICVQAVDLLIALGPKGQAALPRQLVLKRALGWLNEDRNPTQIAGILLVGKLGADAKPALAKLTALEKDRIEFLRQAAREARELIEAALAHQAKTAK